MADYQDKEFKELYAEILEDVKSLTTKWDPSISDESDPGVVLLKAWTLFYDKLQYKINYRNAQNSVREVTNRDEAKSLFFELGYQMKEKTSATGYLKVKALSSLGSGTIAEIPLFCQFTDMAGNLTYTSTRSATYLTQNSSKLIEVQEGIPLQYEYSGKTQFNEMDLTNNLRIYLYGLSNIATNAIVICTVNTDSNEERIDPVVSNWLNTGGTLFTSVETKNLFSIGHDQSGTPYIQFYEDSLPELRKSIEIWVLSSSGSAGNCKSNTISKISTTLPDEVSANNFLISHNDFTSGSDAESIESARNNYYNTFGVNDTLISERDYSETLRSEVDYNLKNLCSQALVTGIDGYQNIIEVISELGSGTQTRLVANLKTLISGIFIDALAYSSEYYPSFDHLVGVDDENSIRKSLYKREVVSNNLILVNGPHDSGDSKESTIYNQFLFDISKLVGTVITNSTDSVDDIREEIIKTLETTYNSKNLKTGERPSESEISQTIKKIKDVTEAVFHYSDDHTIAKSLLVGDKKQVYASEELTEDEKIDIQARMTLSGKTPLFKDNGLSILFGSYIPTLASKPREGFGYFPSSDGGLSLDESRAIVKIVGKKVRGGLPTSGTYQLAENEFLQLYTKLLQDEAVYGAGIGYKLQTDQTQLANDLNISLATLVSGSVIVKDSIIYSTTLDPEKVRVVSKVSENTYKFTSNYIVQGTGTQGGIVIDGSSTLKKGSQIADGSTIEGKKYYNLTIPANTDYQLTTKDTLLLQTGEDSSSIIQLNGSIGGIWIKPSFDLNSSGVRGKALTEDDPVLQSDQQIAKRGYSQLELNQTYLYGVVTANSNGITFNGEGNYILGESEHFIYSDSELIDFLDFGSGTLLTGEPGTSLSNVVTLENFNTSLLSLPEVVIITNTEIHSFIGNDIKVEGLRTLSTEEEIYLPSDWVKLKEDDQIKVTDSSGTQTSFGKQYFARFGLTLNTGVGNFIAINTSSTSGQILEFTDSEGGTFSTTIAETPVVVSFNQSIASGGIETGVGVEDKLGMVAYALSSGITPSIIENGQYKFSIKLLEAKTTKILIQPNQITLNRFKVSDGGKISISVEGDPGAKLLICNVWGEIKTGVTVKELSGEFDFILWTSPGTSPTLNITNTTDNKIITVELTKTKAIKEFYLGEVVFNRVNDLLINQVEGNKVPLDFWYTTDDPIANPLSPESLYDPDHILNRNILTVFNMGELYKSENLRIIRRNK